MKRVHDLAKEQGIRIALFAQDEENSSMFSNVQNVEETGTLIAGAILKSMNDEDIPESAERFVDVIVSAGAHTVEALKGIKEKLIRDVIANNE